MERRSWVSRIRKGAVAGSFSFFVSQALLCVTTQRHTLPCLGVALRDHAVASPCRAPHHSAVASPNCAKPSHSSASPCPRRALPCLTALRLCVAMPGKGMRRLSQALQPRFAIPLLRLAFAVPCPAMPLLHDAVLDLALAMRRTGRHNDAIAPRRQAWLRLCPARPCAAQLGCTPPCLAFAKPCPAKECVVAQCPAVALPRLALLCPGFAVLRLCVGKNRRTRPRPC